MKLPAFLTTPGTPVARIIQFVTAATLAFSLFGLGFIACCLPATTDILANANSNVAYSAYEKETLVSLAQTTRAYTVEGMDYTSYCQAEIEAMKTLPGIDANLEVADPVAAAEAVAELNDGLALDSASVVHLNQVHQVVLAALVAIAAALVLFAACLGHVVCRYNRKAAGICLMAGALGILAVLVLFTCWALIDFNTLFAWMHSLFFADGSWTFDVRSLLICMYPEGFWMGMGVTWLLTTCVASAVALGVGIRMKRNS